MDKHTKLVTFVFSISMLCASLALVIPKARAENVLPTVWIKVHRIQAVDPIEIFGQGGADWLCQLRVSDGETSTTKEFTCQGDDVTVDHVDSFIDLKHKDIYIRIMLYEDDGILGQETADISGTDNYFDCTYYLKTNDFDGDETVVEGGYKKTSGDYDGSTTTDENDANLWFTIWDNYDTPNADAGSDKECLPGEKVNFDGSGSTASLGSSIMKYEWDYENDGIVDAEGQKTSYTYQQKGLHDCVLRVTDSIGESDEDPCEVNVKNPKPEAEFTYSPSNPTVYDTIDFVDQSSDDDYIASWSWDFGDGTTSTSQNPSHKYTQKGSHEVSLTVTDNDGAEGIKTHTIVVINLPPNASFQYTPTNPRTNSDVEFTDKSTDPENITLSSWKWNFGDGYTSDVQNPSHKFASEGDYNVKLTVWDDENATDTFSMVVSVTEPPPSEAEVQIPLWLIGAIIVAILAVTIPIAYVWNRRRTSSTTA